MRKVFILLVLILFLIPNNTCFAKKFKVNASVEELAIEADSKEYVYLKVEDDGELKNAAYLPTGAYLKAEVISVHREKRWHKHAFALLKVVNFIPKFSGETVDVSEDNIYLVARRYVPVDLPNATGIGVELTATTAASFFVPGIDIAYYFTKGAIIREKHPNWFISGVEETYDNSIFWFIQKGRTLNLEDDKDVQLKTISDKKLKKLIKQKD